MKDTSTKSTSIIPDDVSDLGSVASAATNTTTSTSLTSMTEASNSFAKPEYVNPKVAQKEEKWVLYAKCLVAGVLVVAMASLATATFILIKRGEYNEFKTQFQNYAEEIIAVSQENAANTFRSIAGLSVTITSYTESTKAKWPFVTIPNFDAQAKAAESLSGVRLLAFAPVVTKEKKPAWEKYAAKNARATFQQSIDYQNLNVSDVKSLYLWPHIYQGDLKTFQFQREEGEGPYLPMWMLSRFRPELSGMINYNLNDEPRVKKAFATTSITKAPSMNFFVITGTADSILVQPIFDTVMGLDGKKERKVVGILWCLIDWLAYFRNIINDPTAEIMAVVKSSDGDAATYKINGMEAIFLGEGDLHDQKYDDLEVTAEFAKLDIDDAIDLPDHLKVPTLSMSIYATDSLQENYKTYDAHFYTAGVIAIFVFTSAVFVLFDYTVRQQQAKIMQRVIKQDKIVSNLMPQHIRDRLYGSDEDSSAGDSKSPSNKKKDITSGFPVVLNPADFENPEMFNTPPIADLFPSASVFIADIAGFTAWSSQREPPQVFMLLESIFGAFDKLAYKHGVFKIETTMDCYVAVCGLPEPRKKHATATARFARECLNKFKEISRMLEVTLGPDTGDLEMRMGIHSGQVTAGVLRGERSRFQLFGDTVNTASRMETTSQSCKIQVSNTTAELLKKEGKSRWLTKRDGTVPVKGKGNMTTYWLSTKKVPKPEEVVDMSALAAGGDKADEEGSESEALDENNSNELLPNMSNFLTKTDRLIEWNVTVLSELLVQILAARGDNVEYENLEDVEAALTKDDKIPLDEFKEIVTLPKPSHEELQRRKDPSSIVLPDEVVSQLRDYVTRVSKMYLSNPFHNFEHASHVAASVRKMLTRIVNQGEPGDNANASEVDLVDRQGHSYGIASDPLTHFAVIFSAIIHDAEHPGVPNTQLLKEETKQALKYQKSIAEQNSIHVALDLLMKPEYENLRACIYSNENELKRFRQLVINVVLATDICDKELGALRKARWATAFSGEVVDSSPDMDVDRKATIVIEHLIQASDVSHTMQHWQIYLHWNEKFFFELYGAYKAGRSETDPSKGWVNGEVGFFDFYIIPLAKKLETCGVFGVSSHEYLNYAQMNRDEWEREGANILKGYLEKYYSMYPEQKKDD